MTRRSFRVGLVLGLAAGAGVAAVVATRRGSRSPRAALVDGAGGTAGAGEGRGPLDVPVREPRSSAPAPGLVGGPVDGPVAEPGRPSVEAPSADATAPTEATEPPAEPEAGPEPAPGAPPSAAAAADAIPAPGAGGPADPWVTPLDGGSCPVSHPVKAKMTSGLFHLPGMAMYARTRADRCYASADAAEADGLRRSTT